MTAATCYYMLLIWKDGNDRPDEENVYKYKKKAWASEGYRTTLNNMVCIGAQETANLGRVLLEHLRDDIWLSPSRVRFESRT